MITTEQQMAFFQRTVDLKYVHEAGALIPYLAIGDRERAEAIMEQSLRHCESWRDCTDFRLNILLRAWWLYGDRISGAFKQRIHDAAVAGRYYGGYRPDYPMFYSSENHHMNWAVAEYLTAQLFPDEIFTYDGRSSRAHHDRARFLIANWINNRASWGYCEWNASDYMGINLLSLLNLVDFAAEPDIRQLAEDATTRLLADVAADSAYGGVWGAQARIYESSLFGAGNQEAGGALILLLGAGDPESLKIGTLAPSAAATTRYQAPEWLCRLACDLSTPSVSQERHRNEESLYYDCRSAFWRPPFELTNEEARQRFDRFSLPEYPIRTERRAEYLVSALLQPAPGKPAEVKGQAMPWLSCLNGKVPIFANHPRPAGHPKFKAEYWAGTASSPRCHLEDGLLVALYHGKDDRGAADFTHAHFPTAALSEWRRAGSWYLGRLDDAYVGLWAPPAATLTEQGRWSGREILAPGRTAAWVAVYGSHAQDGDFTAFARRCEQVQVHFHPKQAAVEVQAEGRAPVAISHAHGVTVGGASVSCADWPQMENTFVRGEWGSPLTRIDTGAGETTLDFTAAREIAKEWERTD